MSKFPPAPVRTNIVGKGEDSPSYNWERWFQSLTDFNSNPRIPFFTPASSTAKGVADSITHDNNFVYVCVSTNSWKRIALVSF
jgi:hypothetical protein